MIVKMRKLNLIALSYDRDVILNALEQTNAVEVTLHSPSEGTSVLPEDGAELRSYLGELESALETVLSHARIYSEETGRKFSTEDGFEVSYAEFRSAGTKKAEADELTKRIGALSETRNHLLAEQVKLDRAIAAASPYCAVKMKFSAYRDTLRTRVRLGSLSLDRWNELKTSLEEEPLCAYEAETVSDAVILTVIAHRSVWPKIETCLEESGFSICPYREEETGAELEKRLQRQSDETKRALKETEEALFSLSLKIRDLKIFCDYIRFELEKKELSSKLRGTEKTFLLEAYVPAEREETVREALREASGAIYYEFSDPGEDEEVPTLLKNNKVVENFETITNMYSPPNAREIDPNTVMSFFYSLFLGFIMADVGYGLMMLLGGGFLYFKNRSGGIKSLSGVFAVGGIFTIFWGFLFNSILGMQFLPVTLMPDPQTQMYSLSGISLPGVLVISLLLGIVQLLAGYLCRAALCWHRGQYFDGILDGGVWAIFSLGVGLAVVGLVEEFHLSFLAIAGGILSAVSLLIAVLTAGRKEKLLGKFSKGFGSLYGLINYFTDVLSYIRLYGLMLTGAVIAQVVSQYAVQFLTSGSFLIVLGGILMVVGHVFNLAIGLLGAYIHTARLQYVEFFGRFYEGEGTLFTPLGSEKKYIHLEQKAAEVAA